MQIVKLNKDQMWGKKPVIEPVAGTIIAGGAIRQWFSKDESESDIDVFCIDEKSEESFIDTRLKGFKIIGSNKNSITFSNEKSLVQVIQILRPKDVADLFDNFDFHLCQFAWSNDEIFASVEGIMSVTRKHLSIHKLKRDFAVDSLRRAFKYQKKGYEPCLGTIRDLANAFRELTHEEVQNAVEISPGGGRRIVRFD